MTNGSNKLLYWILGAMFTVVMVLLGGAATAFDNRLMKLEQRDEKVILTEAQLRALHDQMCRLEVKIDDLKEDVTKRTVYRVPCAP